MDIVHARLAAIGDFLFEVWMREEAPTEKQLQEDIAKVKRLGKRAGLSEDNLKQYIAVRRDDFETAMRIVVGAKE